MPGQQATQTVEPGSVNNQEEMNKISGGVMPGQQPTPTAKPESVNRQEDLQEGMNKIVGDAMPGQQPTPTAKPEPVNVQLNPQGLEGITSTIQQLSANVGEVLVQLKRLADTCERLAELPSRVASGGTRPPDTRPRQGSGPIN